MVTTSPRSSSGQDMAQKGNDFNGTVPNYEFHHCLRRHLHKKAKRASGGIGIFVKSCFRESVVVSHTVEHCVWISIRSKYTNTANVHIGCVYILPVDTSYCHPEITDYYSVLGKEILSKERTGQIILCGDFNARTGDLIDYTETSNDSTIYHDSVSEPLKSQKLNPDKKSWQLWSGTHWSVPRNRPPNFEWQGKWSHCNI